MRKKIIFIVLLMIIIVFAASPYAFADGDNTHVFRVAVILDGEDIADFSDDAGTLRALTDMLEQYPDFKVTFYFDVANTEKSADLAATLIYFKVRGFRTGVYASSTEEASEFLDCVKYVVKTVERLAITDDPFSFTAAGYSVATDFSLTVSRPGDFPLLSSEQGDTTLKFILSGNTLSEFEKLLLYASENSVGILGTNEKTA
ncbi:MAG: hypothetical protein ACI4QR_04675 [Eubacteriales bacterium]